MVRISASSAAKRTSTKPAMRLRAEERAAGGAASAKTDGSASSAAKSWALHVRRKASAWISASASASSAETPSTKTAAPRKRDHRRAIRAAACGLASGGRR